MGGTVKIESDGQGSGTTFIISIQGISIVSDSVIEQFRNQDPNE